MGWGGVFKKKGDWGILNPSEWTSIGARQKFGNIGPRPQGQLQSIIEYNLGVDQQMREQQPAQRQAPSDGGGVVKIPTRQPVFPMNPAPSTGGGGKSGSNAGGGTTAPAGGGKSGGSGTAKPTKLSASAKKAMSNPVARGR
jgi:hypothetical protein